MHSRWYSTIVGETEATYEALDDLRERCGPTPRNITAERRTMATPNRYTQDGLSNFLRDVMDEAAELSQSLKFLSPN